MLPCSVKGRWRLLNKGLSNMFLDRDSSKVTSYVTCEIMDIFFLYCYWGLGQCIWKLSQDKGLILIPTSVPITIWWWKESPKSVLFHPFLKPSLHIQSCGKVVSKKEKDTILCICTPRHTFRAANFHFLILSST